MTQRLSTYAQIANRIVHESVLCIVYFLISKSLELAIASSLKHVVL